jgi:hypothetical protein
MSDEEILFKNKNRAIKNLVKRPAYQPEYERLNIDPQIYQVKPEEFTNRPIVGFSRLTQGKPSVAAPEHAGDYESHPPQVGQGEELMWPINKDVSRDFSYDEISDPPSDWYEPEAQEAEQVEDDIGLDLEQEQEQEQEQAQEQEQEFDLCNLKVDEYILLYYQNVIDSGPLVRIKNTLTRILLDEESFAVDEFIILKRVNLRVGIFVDD